MNIVAVIPAAGFARRLGLERGSKEVLTIGVKTDGSSQLICDSLLNACSMAGASVAWWVIREEKADIVEALSARCYRGLRNRFVTTDPTRSTPHTLDRAFDRLEKSTVLCGFPDILFEPESAFTSMLTELEQRQADVVLGLFDSDRPEKMDVVVTDDQNQVTAIRIKQPDCGNRRAWILAAWKPTFTRFLHKFLTDHPGDGEEELYLGHVFLAALKSQLRVVAVEIPGARCFDIGTPDDLERIREQAGA